MYILSIVVFPFLFSDCCPEVEQETFLFNVESVEPLNFNHNTINFIEESGSEVSALSYAIIFKTSAPGIVNARPKSRGGGIFISPDCSRVDPLLVLEDQVVALSITATKDVSVTHPAGADLTSLFGPISIIKDNPFSTPPSIVDHIPGTINLIDINKAIVYNAVIDYANQEKSSFFYAFKLLEQPAGPVLLQFKLELTLQSGKKISGLSEPIFLK